MKKIEVVFPAIVSARITEQQKKKIERQAKNLKTTKSEFLRDLINNILNNLP